jgi:hypothetical protein
MTLTVTNATGTNATGRIGRGRALLLAGVLVPALLGPRPAAAQRTTASVQVNVTAAGGAPPAGVTVVAIETATGQAVVGTARADGSQMLAGLTPGEYLVTTTPPSGKEVYRTVRVAVGQSLTLDVDVGGEAVEAATRGETIVIEGRATEATTSEIATNVSREQIDNLPQNNRNFLNFAQLAPGVRLSQDELRQEISSGALGASQTNVFIDGVSLKSNVQQGGIVGQDASRGNPFPQLAVSGFRVITQNYKAEYEQAGGAIISAVTQSGTNEYHGTVFTQFQNESVTATDYFVEKRGDPEPDLARYQVGASAGGPIVKDKLFVFLTYEGNYQNRQSQVFLANVPPELMGRFDDVEGTFTSPFREHLGFGKFTWRPRSDQNVEVSGSLRTESDVRSFGGQTSLEAAENVKNRVFTGTAKHQWWLGSLLNEGTVQFMHNRFNPVPENDGEVGQQFFNGALNSGAPLVIRVGGRDTTQNSGQTSVTLRDDVTFSGIEGAGEHVIKTGAKTSFLHYAVDKEFNGNPLFSFYDDPANGVPDYMIPAEAVYGVGDPTIDANNTQIGLYVQDDWQVNRRLTLNLGVRWDMETNPLNNDFVTPDNVRAALTETPYTYDAPGGEPADPPECNMIPFADCIEDLNGRDFFDAGNYLTDGNDRPVFLGAIQPRLGFAFDLLGDRRTILFGGAGRYYDRHLYNSAVDERFRLQYGVRTFRFSETGANRTDGLPTIQWMPQYLSQDGLDQLIESGVAPNPEIFLLENDTRPLHTDQFSGGVRQQVGPINASATVTYAVSKNGLGFYPANRLATGTRDFLPPPQGFGNVIISVDDRESRYTAVQFTVEKPLDYELSGGGVAWGASAAYSLSWAKERGGEFNFDFATVKDSPLAPTATDERHRVVLTGIAKFPLDFLLSTFIQLGSGFPFTINDQRRAPDPLRVNEGRDDRILEFRQVDVRLAKDFRLAQGHRISAFLDCSNLFNSWNFGGYNGFIPAEGIDANPDFGRPSRLVGPPRQLQLGAAYNF